MEYSHVQKGRHGITKSVKEKGRNTERKFGRNACCRATK
jgi:hypothetical protein